MPPTDPPREGLRARKRRALHARLVEIAGRRFAADGYEATNMRDVADDAGVAYQTLYNHFPGKARLAFAWLESLSLETHDAATALWHEAGAEEDPVAVLVRGADLYVDLVARTDRAAWRAAMAEYMGNPEAFDAEMDLLGRTFLGNLSAILRRGIDDGRLDPAVDPRVLAGTLYVLVDHAIMRFVALPELDRPALLDQLHAQLELVLRPLVGQSSAGR
jgi:AcrR family transcriptional regulator